jgi:hypothetical protein
MEIIDSIAFVVDSERSSVDDVPSLATVNILDAFAETGGGVGKASSSGSSRRGMSWRPRWCFQPAK